MLVEVGKTYVNRAGDICKVLSRTDPPSLVGWDGFYSYFPIENGKENMEQSLLMIAAAILKSVKC
jgi:hypothetical protein